MRRKSPLMFVLTAVAVLLYASRFVPAVGLSPDISDFFGGMSIGLLIGSVVTWFAERS